MPTYDYECQKCKKIIEVYHSIMIRLKTHREADPETKCTGEVVRQFGKPNVTFKGKGWTPKFGSGKDLKQQERDFNDLNNKLDAMGVKEATANEVPPPTI
jgi:putative FmdB family regulatory protein